MKRSRSTADRMIPIGNTSNELGGVCEMKAREMKPERDLASILLANKDDVGMQYLYKCMYGVAMPGTEENPLPANNVVPFPKRISVGRRRQILNEATKQLE